MAKFKVMGLKQEIYLYMDGKEVFDDVKFTIFETDSRKTASCKCEDFVKQFIGTYAKREYTITQDYRLGCNLYVEIVFPRADGTPRSKVVLVGMQYDVL